MQVGDLLGDAVPVVYVLSNVAVLAAVLRNLALPGMAIVAVGAVCNLAAIVANGGYMPADPEALAIGRRGHQRADQQHRGRRPGAPVPDRHLRDPRRRSRWPTSSASATS